MVKDWIRESMLYELNAACDFIVITLNEDTPVVKKVVPISKNDIEEFCDRIVSKYNNFQVVEVDEKLISLAMDKITEPSLSKAMDKMEEELKNYPNITFYLLGVYYESIKKATILYLKRH